MATLGMRACPALLLMAALLLMPRITWADANPPAYTTLILRVNGSGRVMPSYNGQRLKIGSSIRLSAVPAPGFIFAGWTGTFETLNPDGFFGVVPGLELQADFIPNPFSALQGEYIGLVSGRDSPDARTMGFFQFHLDAMGQLKGKLMRTGQDYIYSLDQSYSEWPNERIDSSGSITGWIFRNWLFYARGGPFGIDEFRQDLTAEIQFDFLGDNDFVQGVLSDSHEQRIDGSWQTVPATWQADMLACRAVFDSRTNPAPQAGSFTLVFPPGNGANQPEGAGFASLKIDTAGRVRMTGFLADGSLISQSAFVSKDGRWPLFSRLYGAHGALAGWMSFTNTDQGQVSGTLAWTRPRGFSAPAYPAGFTNSVIPLGSRYFRPVSQIPAVNWTHGIAIFSGADLTTPVTNMFTVGPGGRMETDIRLSLSVNPATELFSGKFKHPVSARTVSFKGALLQQHNCGYGYFLDAKRESGLVYIGPSE